VALRRVIVVSLFVPLPLLTSAWQAALGGGGWLGPTDPGRPWAIGMRAAVWVHAAAGLPWVVWLVGQGLCWVEPEAEGVARAVAVALPGTVLVALAVGWAVWRWERAVPPLGSAPEPRPLVGLGPVRWPAAAGVLAVVGLSVAIPLGSLVWKLGLHGYPAA